MSAVKQFDMERPATTETSGRSRGLWFLTAVAAVGVLIGLYMALVYAGTDSLQGNVQRIFYLHLPSFFGATLAFFLTVIGGIAFLRTRNIKWDVLATAGVEVGLMLFDYHAGNRVDLGTSHLEYMVDMGPRLTSAAIMALTYAAYLMLREGIESPDKRRTFASVYGILAFTTVLFTILVIRLREDTIHPAVVGSSPTNAEGGFAMTTGMGMALGTNFAVWVLLVTPVLMWWRVKLENKLETVRRMREEMLA